MMILAGGLAGACDGDAIEADTFPNDDPPASHPAAPGSASARALPPLPAEVTDGPCDIRITGLAIYQGVKIPLVEAGRVVQSRTVDLVVHRPALVRVFVSPGPGWGGRHAAARLTLRTAAGDVIVEDMKEIVDESHDARLSSTLNLPIEAGALSPDARYSVSLFAPASCQSTGDGTRFPATGEAELATRRTGILKVRLVPIRYDADGSARLPDTSDEQLARFRDRLMALFPVGAVELSVREEVATDIRVSGRGWSDLLDDMRLLRSRDSPPPDVYYYGLVAPAATFSAYCPQACVAGVAFRASVEGAGLRVGVGVGYAGENSASSMAHELGHQHGLGHAPCSASSELDERYPYPNGGVGTWGLDPLTHKLYDPAIYRDLMGYCRPAWISDYSYRALLMRSAAVNSPRASTTHARQPLVAPVVGDPVDAYPPDAGAPEQGQGWRVVIIDAHGQPRWGRPWSGPLPRERRATATIVGKTEAGLTITDVYPLELGDSDERMIVVPDARPGWLSIELGRPATRALSYAAAKPMGIPLGPARLK